VPPSDMTKAAVLAVAERVKRSTAVVLSDGGANQFTAILFSLDGRHFAMTAGHCVHAVRNKRSLLFSTFAAQSPGVPVPRAQLLAHDDLDIGVIVLQSEAAIDLKAEWLTLADLSSNRIRPGENVVFVGFPAGLFRVEQGSVCSVASATPVALALEVSSRWPRSDLSRPADPAVDFFLDWDITRVLQSGLDRPIEPFSPSGMSGSGIFWVPCVDGQRVWSPTEICLAGVLSSTIDQEQLMRCMRIEHALNLLGFRLEIGNEQRFPG
jgi:hypothetical protein